MKATSISVTIPDDLKAHMIACYGEDYLQTEKGQIDLLLYEVEQLQKLTVAAPDLLAALKGLLDHYVALANSGDCGFWNPETEDQVIAARAAIEKAEPPHGL